MDIAAVRVALRAPAPRPAVDLDRAVAHVRAELRLLATTSGLGIAPAGGSGFGRTSLSVCR